MDLNQQGNATNPIISVNCGFYSLPVETLSTFLYPIKEIVDFLDDANEIVEFRNNHYFLMYLQEYYNRIGNSGSIIDYFVPINQPMLEDILLNLIGYDFLVKQPRESLCFNDLISSKEHADVLLGIASCLSYIKRNDDKQVWAYISKS